MLKELTATQRQLADYMSDLSEEAFCALWMIDLEYELWQLVLGRTKRYGQMEITADQRGELIRLVQQVGGWIALDADREEVFVPLADWNVLFAQWARQAR